MGEEEEDDGAQAFNDDDDYDDDDEGKDREASGFFCGGHDVDSDEDDIIAAKAGKVSSVNIYVDPDRKKGAAERDRS
eukprot:9496855-Heterocapsa_arctica.AAC.1